MKEHLRKNLINKSKFYIIYSEFQKDIPLNKIIKSTLQKLLSLTKSSSNRSRISSLLDIIAEIPQSSNIKWDLQHCKNLNRLFIEYKKLIEWSELFLLNKGFTNFSGKNVNLAMLFPMERVFESFIAHQIRKYNTEFSVSTQHSKFHLVEKYQDKPKYKLKPDVFASRRSGEGCIILDTKWKIIEDDLKKKSINQSDMYQLYAYGRKYLKGYGEPILYLIYPQNNKFTKELLPFYYEKEGDFWLKLFARPFDLRGNYKSQIGAIFESFNKAKTENISEKT